MRRQGDKETGGQGDKDVVTIETPEHVVFEYELAGVASRIFAAMIDLLIVCGILLVILVAMAIMAGGGGWATAFGILSAFVTLWGYPVFFEIYWRGQTPGKRVFGMRVVREGGYALTPPVVIVRNLLRVADFLPACYLLGLIVMMVNRRCKRIGDFAAGTLVIRDRPRVVIPDRLETRMLRPDESEAMIAEIRKAGVHRLAAEEIHRIEELLRRRGELDVEPRMKLLNQAARQLSARLGVRMTGSYRFLQNLVLAYRQNEAAVTGEGGAEAAFVKRHRPDWVRLEGYAARVEAVKSTMTGPELFTFISLYRKVAGDLARAKTLEMRPDLIDYLNQLVGKVHFRVYAARRFPVEKALEFYSRIFPQTVRRLWRYVLASAALLLVPAALSYVAVRRNPHLGTAFAPPGYVEHIEEMFGKSFGKEGRTGGQGAMYTSFYIANNVQVSFLAFASGIFLGLGSAYILVKNGMILGGVAAVIQQFGLSYNFWSFVSSHGGIEMGAIVLAGAAGMRLGLSFVNPGMLTRRAALVAGARDAGLVMFGVISMLVVAALLEAFVSPSTLPNPVKLSLGAVNLAGVVAYLAFVGRK